MTDAKRGAMLLLLGLFTAVLLYPALHEGGHILVTLLLGGRIREVRLGAAASVLRASEYCIQMPFLKQVWGWDYEEIS